MVKAGLRCVATVLLLSPTRQRDQSHVCDLPVSPQFAGHIQTTDYRQTEVEEDDIRSVRHSRRDGAQPVEGGSYLMPHSLDRQFQHLEQVVVLISTTSTFNGLHGISDGWRCSP